MNKSFISNLIEEEIQPNLFIIRLNERVRRSLKLEEGNNWYEVVILTERNEDNKPIGIPIRTLNHSQIEFIKQKYNAVYKKILPNSEMGYWIFQK